MNSFDVIDGGSGTDTLNVTLNGASYAADSTIRNIEAINVRASTAHDFNANALTGIANMTLEGSVAASSFTNLGSAATALGMRNIADAGADLTAVFADAALTGTNDTVTVNLNAAGNSANAPTLLVRTTGSTNGAENLNVVTSGTASVLAELRSATNAALLADNQAAQTGNTVLKKLTVTGDQNLTVSTILEFAAGTGTVDASTLTGKLNIGLDVGGAVNVTGGTADDTLSFTTGLTVDDTVNGGAGVDTVSVTNMDTFTLASFAKMTNIEVIDQISTAGNALVLTTGGAALTRAILRENATDTVAITASDLAAGVAVELVQVGGGAVQMANVTLGLKDGSGTADALTVTLKGVAAATAANNAADALIITNIETLNLVSSSTSTTGGVLAAADANTLTTITADTTLASINASGTSALIASVGAAATKLTKFDASSMTGDLALTLAAGDVSVTGGAGDDTFTFAATLNNKDAVVGGANTTSSTEDLLTATVTSLTATTGALTISGVERINLTNAGTAVIDATKITGATEIAMVEDAAAVSTTFSGLAAGSKIGLGFKGTATAATVLGTVTLSLADEAGTADSVTLNLNDTRDADVNTVTLKTTAIETVNLAYSTTAATLANLTVTSTDFKASTINVTGSDADTDNTVTFGTLSTSTTKLDGSTFKGILSATAGTGTAITFLGNGAQANVLTGSSGADTFTVGSTTATQDLTGGTGSDTVNITISGATSFASIDQMETINVTVAASATASSNADNAFNDTNLTKLTINGGNSLSTFANTGITAAATVTTIDASAFAGKANLVFADDGLTATRNITGGANTDTVAASYSNVGSVLLKMSAIETLLITETTGGAATDTLDLGSVTGLTKVTVVDTANVANEIVLTNFDLTKTSLQLGNAADAGGGGTGVFGIVTVTGASTTGATDALTVTVQDLDATGTTTLNANGVETINLSIATDVAQAQTLSVSDVNATNKFVVNVTGGTAAQSFTLGSVSTNATSVDASTFIGNLTFSATARVGSTAMTINGGTGTDALNMKHANDVINGGTGTDTLTVVQNAVLGGFLIDLSSTVDQITTYNGSANSAVQKGFESVNLSGITGTFGADVTANSAGSTITGTANADVITGGAGIDTIMFAAGSAGAIAVANNGVTARKDAITWSSTNDILNFTGLMTQDSYTESVGTIITVTNNDIVVVNAGTTAAGVGFANSIAEFGNMWSAGGATALNTTGSLATVGDKAIIITAQDATNSTGIANVWFIQEIGDTNGFTAAEDFIQLIGTINVGTAGTASTITSTLATGNFV